MNAVEARTLTDGARAESVLAYMLRTRVFPAIEWAAKAGFNWTTFDVGNHLGSGWNSPRFQSVIPAVISELQSRGFMVEWGYASTQEVKVTW